MQIPFDLAFKPSYQREDYIVNTQNKPIMAMLDAWPKWQSPWLFIEGKKGAGKTHLAHIFAEKLDAVLIKDLSVSINKLMTKTENKSIVIDCGIDGDREKQKNLFHLINQVKQQQKYGVILSEPMDEQGDIIVLADLLSRLSQMPLFKLEEPDDDLLKALIVKLFSDRQLRITEAQINWMIPRIRRSFSFVEKYVDALDKASLAHKKSITQTMLKKELEALML